MWRSAWIGLAAGLIAIVSLALLNRFWAGRSAAVQTHRWGALPVAEVPGTAPADRVTGSPHRVLRAYDITEILAWAAKHSRPIGTPTLPRALTNTQPTNRAAVAAAAVTPGAIRAGGGSIALTNTAGGTFVLQTSGIADPPERLVQWMIRYDFDRGGLTDDGASIGSWMQIWSGKLLAIQTPEGHERLRTFLEEMRALDDEKSP